MKNIILIPYRNREIHLKYWIMNTYPKLNKVLENLEVLVIEQSKDNKLFNRGKVLNVGFKYYDKDEYNYFTHDVDHNSININIYNIKINNNTIISLKSGHNKSLGGIIKFKGNVFKKINGFNNNYWGWGIEDRDLYYRSVFYKINIIRDNKTRFKVLNHKHKGYEFNKKKSDKCDNIFNSNNNNKIKEFILESGLNNLEYKIIKEENIKDNIKKIIVEI